jgi:hypothetical protein
LVILYALLLIAIGSVGCPRSEDPAIGEFRQKIEKYMDLRSSAVEGIPELKARSTAEEIVARTLAVRHALLGARFDTAQGQIFTPAVSNHIISIIYDVTKGKIGASRREAALGVGNPHAEGISVKVSVNGLYPDGAPRSFMPPTLLLRLPALPEELAYRFVGRDLILLDSGAALIIDFIPNAL